MSEKRNKSTGRDYSYDTKYQNKPEQVKNRMARNRARAKMIREGKARVGDGKDVDHINSDASDNSGKNLRVVDKSKNRGRMSKGRRV